MIRNKTAESQPFSNKGVLRPWNDLVARQKSFVKKTEEGNHRAPIERGGGEKNGQE